ncbi:hypothetical protein CBW22_20585, partial [Pantoea sp. VS1]|uniref:hypothetical protein n=1 Tax=Pantoea sp. VS1 TaxID=2003658 RepID=UPI000B62A866
MKRHVVFILRNKNEFYDVFESLKFSHPMWNAGINEHGKRQGASAHSQRSVLTYVSMASTAATQHFSGAVIPDMKRLWVVRLS